MNKIDIKMDYSVKLQWIQCRDFFNRIICEILIIKEEIKVEEAVLYHTFYQKIDFSRFSVTSYINAEVSVRTGRAHVTLWYSKLPDCTTLHFNVWGFIKYKVFRLQFLKSISELKLHINAAQGACSEAYANACFTNETFSE